MIFSLLGTVAFEPIRHAWMDLPLGDLGAVGGPETLGTERFPEAWRFRVVCFAMEEHESEVHSPTTTLFGLKWVGISRYR